MALTFNKLTKDEKVKNLKIAVYGNPGLEKSRYSMNGLENCVVMDIDHGLSSVDNENISVHNVPTDPEDLMATITSYNELIDYIKSDENQFKVLVIDIMSKYSDILAKLYQELDPDGWGLNYSIKIEEKMNELMSLPITVIVLFHESTITDGERLKKAPMLSGNKVRSKIPGYFDVVMRAEVSSNEDENGRAILSWKSREDVVAKNRLLGMLPEGVTHIGGNSELQNVQDLISACTKG